MRQSLITANTGNCSKTNLHSNASNGFFEGVEKLLEIWFSQSAEDLGSGDARDITRLVSWLNWNLSTFSMIQIYLLPSQWSTG